MIHVLFCKVQGWYAVLRTLKLLQEIQSGTHDYIIFKTNRGRTYNPAGLMFLMPEGHRKHIRLIRTPTNDSLKGRAAVIVLNRKGVLLVFVNVYVNVQKWTRGHEPAEDTRENY